MGTPSTRRNGADQRAGEHGADTDRRMATGRAGEAAAREFLTGRGHEIVATNWRCRAGEIDVITVDPGGDLRIVEVRTRTGRGFGTPGESITGAKRRRLRTLAAHWLEDQGRSWPRVAFDVVGVDLRDPARPVLELYEDVL